MEDLIDYAVEGGFPLDHIDVAILLQILNRQQRIQVHQRFNLQEVDEKECRHLFRFEKNDIPRPSEALRIPEQVMTDTRLCVTGVEALCIVLRRLAYPNRLADLEPFFGLSPQSLSEIFNQTVDLIYEMHETKLHSLIDVNWLNYEKLNYYSEAIFQKGSPLENCWGFIDGTIRPICRPTENQQQYYSGHKRVHCIKFQSIICPDGIIVNMKGAYPGSRHDAGIYRETQLYRELQEKTVFPDRYFVIYGDQAYPLQDLLLRPFSQLEAVGNPGREEFNRRMSLLRQCVEWGFHKICQQFAFIDFKKNLKVMEQELGKMFLVSVLLTNCHTCLYSSQTAQYFGIAPPELEEYLA